MTMLKLLVAGLALSTFLIPAAPASARPYIEKLYPLKDVMKESVVIAEGHIESVNPKTRTAVMKVQRSLKGKCPFTVIKMNIGVGQAWHPKALMPHLRIGAPAIIFYNQGRQAEIYINRFFCQLYGSGAQPPDKGWWNFTHVEIKMNRTFDGPVKDLARVVENALRGKGRAPAPNPKKAPMTKAQIDAMPKFGGSAPAPAPKGVLVKSFQDGVAPNASYAGTRDTSLVQSQPDANTGARGTASVDGDDPNSTGHDAAAVLRWDVSAIAPGSKVRSAEIVLHVTDTSSSAYPIFALKQAWNEKAATWKNRDGGVAWQTPGARGSNDRGNGPVGTAPAGTSGAVTIRLSATGLALVQSWVDRPATNFGVIVAHADFTDGLDFALREAPTSNQRPRLNVTYVDAKVGSSSR